MQFSKDFNKWNAYVAIKKNYREWEISERESVETNPVYSNFCMVTDKPEFYALIGIYETEEAMTDVQLNALLPTPTQYSPAWQSADQFMVINKVGDTYTKCKTYDDHYTRRWSREQIYLEKGVLVINDKYLNTTETDNYYATLQNEKGVLNDKFFIQLVTRMSNVNAPMGEMVNGSYAKATEFIQQKLGRDPKNGDTILNRVTGVLNPYWKYTYTTQWTAQELTRQQYEDLAELIMHKISWVVGTCYSNEWQGGADYRQIKKSFILPCACFSLGNSVVFDFGAQDNYAMATYVAPANGEGTQYNLLNPAQEQYVEYGDRFGKVENLELQYGYEDAIKNAYTSQTSANSTSKELYSIDTAELNKDNVMLDYKTNSEVEIALEEGISKVWWAYYGSMSSEFPLPYTLLAYCALKDKNTMVVSFYSRQLDSPYTVTKLSSQIVTKTDSESYFRFTYGSTTYRVTPTGWCESSVAGDQGYQMSATGVIIENNDEYYAGTDTITITNTYTITTNDREHDNLTLQLGTKNYYSYKTTSGMFRINKDSRQSLQFTNQLHFITDNSNIWIGSALAKTMPFVGQLENGIYKMVGFTKRPSKFEIVPNPDDYEELTGSWTKWYSNKTYTMKLYGLLAQNDYKGVGILDNKNRLVLYYNKEVGTGEYTPTLYIRLRRKL